jgi:predicted house-cleaning NTP pyrophosphatase (Maf/HAM1 superfamily)
MFSLKRLGIVAVLIPCCYAGARDVRTTFDWLKKGAALTADQARKLEQRLVTKPMDEEARIELLSYYAGRTHDLGIEAVKIVRANHIFWLIENDPKTGLGLFQVATGVYRLHCIGDELADMGAFRRAADLWVAQVHKHSRDTDILREAVDAIQHCSPEAAETLLTEANDRAGLGRLYASAVLGITGRSYTTNDPAGSDVDYRKRPFALKAQQALESATDEAFLVSAASTLLRDGAILWADGKLDWDYTPLGNTLLARAKEKSPNAMHLLTLPTTLPGRGERPPQTIRVGGNVQADKLISQAKPAYPVAARELGISGIVRMTALLGLDGSILYLRPESGPTELIPASVEAVRQWRYKPTLLNGRPCYVLTLIDVNYTLN